MSQRPWLHAKNHNRKILNNPRNDTLITTWWMWSWKWTRNDLRVTHFQPLGNFFNPCGEEARLPSTGYILVNKSLRMVTCGEAMVLHSASGSFGIQFPTLLTSGKSSNFASTRAGLLEGEKQFYNMARRQSMGKDHWEGSIKFLHYWQVAKEWKGAIGHPKFKKCNQGLAKWNNPKGAHGLINP